MDRSCQGTEALLNAMDSGAFRYGQRFIYYNACEKMQPQRSPGLESATKVVRVRQPSTCCELAVEHQHLNDIVSAPKGCETRTKIRQGYTIVLSATVSLH